MQAQRTDQHDSAILQIARVATVNLLTDWRRFLTVHPFAVVAPRMCGASQLVTVFAEKFASGTMILVRREYDAVLRCSWKLLASFWVARGNRLHFVKIVIIVLSELAFPKILKSPETPKLLSTTWHAGWKVRP